MLSQKADLRQKYLYYFLREQNLRKQEERRGQDSVKGMLIPLSLHLSNAHTLPCCVDVQLSKDVSPGHRAECCWVCSLGSVVQEQ